jgi:hypothetical protein
MILDKRRYIAPLLTVILIFSIGSVKAAVLNINAVSNNTLNPVNVFFDAGTYVLNPIGTVDGGTFNAFSAGPGTGGRVGSWKWQYSFSSAEFGRIDVNFGPFQLTEMDAFATAVSASFTLTQGANVEFFIADGPNGYEYSGDNFGGISLSTVPVPAAAWLFGSGLIGLIGIARRKKA